MRRQKPEENKKNRQNLHIPCTWGRKRRGGENQRYVGSSKGHLRLGNLAYLNLAAADFGVVVNQDKEER